MIQIGAEAFSVNDCLAVIKTVQIGAFAPLIATIRLLLRDAGTHVFNNARAFTNGSGGVDANGVNAGGTDNQGHETNFA